MGRIESPVHSANIVIQAADEEAIFHSSSFSVLSSCFKRFEHNKGIIFGNKISEKSADIG